LVKKTNGKTLLSNIELVKNNALLGAKVAKALILLKKFTER
jgi:pseudouridine-5'-phosphate glycosidase